MGMKLDRMRAEWAVVREKAFIENWQAFKQVWWRPLHHLLDVFTESFRHGPYWSSHVWVPLWVVLMVLSFYLGRWTYA